MVLDTSFILMNKDREVLAFSMHKDERTSAFSTDKVERTPIVKIQESEKTGLPLPLGFTNLRRWLRKRQAPKHREHIAALLRTCGCYDMDGYVRVTHALSLNDTFWVKEKNSPLRWDAVSLYQNEFDEVIARIAFEGGLHEERFSTTSPEFATDGTYAKCWVRKKGDILLFKKGSSGARNTGMEPYSEFYSAQVAKEICKKAVAYDLEKYRDSLVSGCPLFTNEAVGFTPIAKLLRTDDPKTLLQRFEAIGDGESFRRMLVLDALILNTDRHLGNFGVLMENDTQNIIGMAPVFDHNMALLPFAEAQDFSDMDEYLAERPTRLGIDFNETAHQMLTPEIKADLRNLKGFTFTRHEKLNLPEERLEILEGIVNDQIDRVLKDIRLYVPEVAIENGKKHFSQTVAETDFQESPSEVAKAPQSEVTVARRKGR